MKFKIKLLIAIILSLVCVEAVMANNLPLIGKTIIIDPGHGGADPGTIYNNIYEKDINLKISKDLEKSLSKLGAIVILTRNEDYDLSAPNAIWRKKSDFDNRIRLINNSDANLYISIHLNYLTQVQYKGPQVFYNKDNKKMAQILQEELNKELNGNRNIKQIPAKTYMYEKLNIPGVLIECGFLSNYDERRLLNTEKYQEKIASIIAEAVVKYINS